MTDFLKNIPAPRRATDVSCVASDPSLASYALVSTSSFSKTSREYQAAGIPNSSQIPSKPRQQQIPRYGCRAKWIPRSLDDFEDGGSYPEIHVAQFPLEMGRVPSSSAQGVVALQTGDGGKLSYDAVIRQGLQHRLAVYTRPEDAKPKWSVAADLQKPSAEEEEQLQVRTKAALDAALSKRVAASGIASTSRANQEPEYIKYTPSEQAPGHNANCGQRLIRMVEAQVDPIDPPKHRHKRVPGGPRSPPPAILHSPPRKLTAKDQEEWRIPPCISNWKNQKGYTIPLDKRLAADGRALQDVSINDKFASLSEALYIAERSAREQIRTRNELLKQKKQQEESVREQQLRDLAAKARAQRAAPPVVASTSSSQHGSSNHGSTHHHHHGPSSQHRSASREENQEEDQEEEEDGIGRQQRQQIERDRRRKVERDLRLERAGKKRTRDEDRDISERIALGQAKPTSQEGLFDSRLFNQVSGLDSGYADGGDKYNVYDKPLFVDRSKQSVYRIDAERMEQSVGSMDRMPAFAGADTSAGRHRTAPVEFEKDVEDPFGLESLMKSSRKKQKT